MWCKRSPCSVPWCWLLSKAPSISVDRVRFSIMRGTVDGLKDQSEFGMESLSERSRLFRYFSFNINPTIRHTIWSQVIGGFFYWLQTNAVSQNMIQRYLSLPSVRAGRKALWIFVGGVITLMLLCAYNGLLIYATYKNCDPLTTKVWTERSTRSQFTKSPFV